MTFFNPEMLAVVALIAGLIGTVVGFGGALWLASNRAQVVGRSAQRGAPDLLDDATDERRVLAGR